MTAFAARLAAVRARAGAAAASAGRDADRICIVGVSKRQPAAAVREAVAAGLRDFGENFAQELLAKREELGAVGDQVRWHFIGRLQRNKAKLVVGRAALIHCVDSLPLAEEISRRAVAAEITQEVLVGINLAGEAQKSGVDPADAAALIERLAELPGVECRGLMAMPPWPRDPEDSRPHFRALCALRDRLAAEHGPLPELSMGTTGDYPVAAEEGATLVRVGTALFGPRRAP